jgi:hypothetical protein
LLWSESMVEIKCQKKLGMESLETKYRGIP